MFAAPMQKWIPAPKVIWAVPRSWVMSNSFGCSQTSGSRLAPARNVETMVPCGNFTSRYTTSSEAKRTVARTAPR